MNALEEIFEGYYEKRLNGDIPEPETMWQPALEVANTVQKLPRTMGKGIPELMSIYGREAEKLGFVSGFRMAWELLRNLQEGGGKSQPEKRGS